MMNFFDAVRVVFKLESILIIWPEHKRHIFLPYFEGNSNQNLTGAKINVCIWWHGKDDELWYHFYLYVLKMDHSPIFLGNLDLLVRLMVKDECDASFPALFESHVNHTFLACAMMPATKKRQVSIPLEI